MQAALGRAQGWGIWTGPLLESVALVIQGTGLRVGCEGGPCSFNNILTRFTHKYVHPQGIMTESLPLRKKYVLTNLSEEQTSIAADQSLAGTRPSPQHRPKAHGQPYMVLRPRIPPLKLNLIVQRRTKSNTISNLDKHHSQSFCPILSCVCDI